MEIASIPFIILAIVSFFVFYLINDKYRVVYLVILSCLFIASYSLILVGYVFFFGIINYMLGLYLIKSKHKKVIYWIGILFNLTQLAILRYHTFLFDPVFRLFQINFGLSVLSKVIVPLGISYYTLQGIGYLINIYKGWEKPENSVFHFILYIIFFPKFLSGPIERSNGFLPQLKGILLFDQPQITEGIRIFLIGYFKKIVIANQLGIIVNSVYANVESFSAHYLWLTILIQPFYLYFDFSAYTDIAIGLAKTFGLNLSPNFERPFFAENISTFWRRFHMSLTNWLNFYVFRQVSYSYRKWGIYASIFAVFITFILFGIWHGAGWNFMVLGFIQALAINYEFFTKKYRVRLFSKIPDFCRIWISRILTFCFFGGSLVFFFSPDINTSFAFYGRLFSNYNNFKLGVSDQFGVSKWNILAAFTLFIIFLAVELLNNDYKVAYIKLKEFWINKRWLRLLVYYIMIVLIIRYLESNEAFIYQIF